MVVVSPREEEEEEDKKAQKGESIFLCRMSVLRAFLLIFNLAETSFFFLFLSINRSKREIQKRFVLKNE